MMNFLCALSLIVSSLIAAVISSGGLSNIYQMQDGKGGYDFAYDIVDSWGSSNYREETGSFDKWGGSIVGSYGLADVDGRKRVVKYSADKKGFVAYIKTNEKGTSDEDAADAIYNGLDWNTGKWLYDFNIKHDKSPWPKHDKWSKSDKHKAWAASEKQEEYLFYQYPFDI